MRQFKAKIKNAYVLIYNREEMYDMGRVNDVMDNSKNVSVPKDQLAQIYESTTMEMEEQAQLTIP